MITSRHPARPFRHRPGEFAARMVAGVERCVASAGIGISDPIRPALALRASVGAGPVVKREHLLMRLQADVQNFNNRLNLINFAGLFSGTGVGPPRSYSIRLELGF